MGRRSSIISSESRGLRSLFAAISSIAAWPARMRNFSLAWARMCGLPARRVARDVADEAGPAGVAQRGAQRARFVGAAETVHRQAVEGSPGAGETGAHRRVALERVVAVRRGVPGGEHALGVAEAAELDARLRIPAMRRGMQDGRTLGRGRSLPHLRRL